MSQNSLKEKILALLTVIFLFLLVGGLFFLISLNNINKTNILKSTVIKIQKEKEIKNNFGKIQFSTSTLSEVTAKSFLTVAFINKGPKKILALKNPDLPLPIASITKLMVAVVTLENIDPELFLKRKVIIETLIKDRTYANCHREEH